MKNIAIGYIGTYTDSNSKGIYRFTFNENSKNFSPLSLEAKIDNPTYLVINQAKDTLYSVAKGINCNGTGIGGVASFKINSDCSLSLTNKILSDDKPPCHVSLINNDTVLVASYYHDKHATAYLIKNGNTIKDMTSKVIHQGPSHIHYSSATPDNKYVCILDLGRDEICLYEFLNGKFQLNEALTIYTKQGSGPRHMVFSPCGNFAYVLCELSSEIITLKYLGKNGFELVNYTSTLPNDYLVDNATAAIRITSDGKYLYASNRGHNSIASYKINEDGNIDLISTYPTYGKEPRDFNITPSGNFLIIGNHKSNSITIYKRLENGELILTKKDIYSPSPVCIAFI